MPSAKRRGPPAIVAPPDRLDRSTISGGPGESDAPLLHLVGQRAGGNRVNVAGVWKSRRASHAAAGATARSLAARIPLPEALRAVDCISDREAVSLLARRTTCRNRTQSTKPRRKAIVRFFFLYFFVTRTSAWRIEQNPNPLTRRASRSRVVHKQPQQPNPRRKLDGAVCPVSGPFFHVR